MIRRLIDSFEGKNHYISEMQLWLDKYSPSNCCDPILKYPVNLLASGLSRHAMIESLHLCPFYQLIRDHLIVTEGAHHVPLF
jgi:hypothetical protein